MIGYKDVPDEVQIDNLDDLKDHKDVYDDYIKEYNEKAKNSKNMSTKGVKDRSDVVDSAEELNNYKGVSVVDTDTEIPFRFEDAVSFSEKKLGREITDLYDFLQHKIEDQSTTDLDISHIVHISNDVATNLIESRGVDDSSKGDSFEREGNEDDTGQFSEVAFEQLAYYTQKHHNLDIKSIPDESGMYAGDYLINGFITELKGCKSDSKGQNITHRNHNHPTTASMFIKSGIVPEMYVHAVVLDLREFGFGVVVGFSGMTTAHPDHGGLLSLSPSKIFSGFIVQNIDELDWFDLTDFGWHQLKNRVEKIEL